MTKKETAIRYVLLKIQSQEWKSNTKIMSSRGLMYRFKLNKTAADKVYKKLISAGVIYANERSGYYVAENNESLFESKAMKYNQEDIKTSFSAAKLTPRDIKNINSIKSVNIKRDDYFGVCKEY